VLGRHTLRTPKRRDLKVTRFAAGQRLIGRNLVSKPVYDPPEMLHWLILGFTLLFLLKQREGFLAEKLKVESSALDALFVVSRADPVFRIEEVAHEIGRVLTIPVEPRPKIEEPSHPVPDGQATSPAGFVARLCDERLERRFADRVVDSFQ